MIWLMIFVVLAIVIAFVYLYQNGFIRFYAENKRKQHELIFNMWLDCLDAVERTRLYGDETERVVGMIRNGFEQMVFDMSGYEALVNLDNKLANRKNGEKEISIFNYKREPFYIFEKTINRSILKRTEKLFEELKPDIKENSNETTN